MNDLDSSKHAPHVPTEKEELFSVIVCTVGSVGLAIYFFVKTNEIPWWFLIIFVGLFFAWCNYFPKRITEHIGVTILAILGIGGIIGLLMGLAAMGITTLLLLIIIWQLSRVEDRKG